jgi:activator of HSP90 ATPase
MQRWKADVLRQKTELTKNISMAAGYFVKEKENLNMIKVIQHMVSLPAKPGTLYDMYINPEIHAAFTGGGVVISPESNSQFMAFDGMIFGRTLSVIPGRQVIQSWRSKEWKESDRDSVLILNFLPDGDAGKIELIHVNVAEGDFDDVNKGWLKYYWKPWRAYLKKETNEAGLRAA